MIIMVSFAFAFVCFALAAFGVGSPRINLIAAGLAFGTLAMMIGKYGL